MVVIVERQRRAHGSGYQQRDGQVGAAAEWECTGLWGARRWYGGTRAGDGSEVHRPRDGSGGRLKGQGWAGRGEPRGWEQTCQQGYRWQRRAAWQPMASAAPSITSHDKMAYAPIPQSPPATPRRVTSSRRLELAGAPGDALNDYKAQQTIKWRSLRGTRADGAGRCSRPVRM